MRGELLGVLLVLGAGVCWGSAGVLSKLLMGFGFTALAATTYRLVLGFALMSPFAVRRRVKARLSLKGFVALLLAGVWGTGIGILSYFTAVKLTSAQIAVILLYTAPFFAVGLARLFLGERITFVKAGTALTAFLGCFLVAKGYSPVSAQLMLPGVAAGVLSGLSYAVYTVCGRIVLRETDGFTMAYWCIGLGAVAVGVAGVSAGGLEGMICPESIALIFMLAVIPTIAAFTLYSSGLKYVEAGKANILASVEIVSAIVLAYFILGERMELLQWLGGILVLIAVVALHWFTWREEVKHAI